MRQNVVNGAKYWVLFLNPTYWLWNFDKCLVERNIGFICMNPTASNQSMNIG
jgi:hypothetical protein